MNSVKLFKVAQIARLSGVTVRTLHYYEQLGLLKPTQRNSKGFRLYDEAALLRLQQVLIQRGLGLPLKRIRDILDDPDFDYRQALVEQRELLRKRVVAAEKMLGAVEAALSQIAHSSTTTSNQDPQMENLFNGINPKQYEKEAEQRWGNSEAFKESRARTKTYGKDEWTAIKQEQSAIYGELAKLKDTGSAPESKPAMDIAERHRLSIDRWFYPCSPAMHCGLADLYEADERFQANIDKYGESLTAFLAAAIRHNAARANDEE